MSVAEISISSQPLKEGQALLELAARRRSKPDAERRAKKNGASGPEQIRR